MKRDYEKKLKALAELDNCIESTVDKSNHSIIIDLTTTYEKLKALKEKLEPKSKQLSLYPLPVFLLPQNFLVYST